MIKKTQPFVTPKAPEIQYRNELYKLIRAMCKEYKDVISIYREKKDQLAMDADGVWLTTAETTKLESLGATWAKRFQEFAKQYSPKYVKNILRMSNTQIKSMMRDWFSDKRLELFGSVIPTDLRQIVNANVAYNVTLISDIPKLYHYRVYGSIMRSITGGGSLKQLTMEIMRYGNRSLKQAKLVARDQTAKVYNSITLYNCKRLGVKKMQWIHSHGDKEPRPFHIRQWDGKSSPQNPNGLDGLIFDIDNPPLIQREEVRNGKKIPEVYGYPKKLYGCTCLMAAVIDT